MLLDILKGEKVLGGGGTPEGAQPQLTDEGFLSSFPFKPVPVFPESLPRGVPEAELTPTLQEARGAAAVRAGSPAPALERNHR